MLERTLQQLAPVLVLFLAVFSIVLAQKDLRLPESRVSSRTVDVLEAQLNLTYSASVDRGQEFHFVYTIPLAYEEQVRGKMHFESYRSVSTFTIYRRLV